MHQMIAQYQHQTFYSHSLQMNFYPLIEVEEILVQMEVVER